MKRVMLTIFVLLPVLVSSVSEAGLDMKVDFAPELFGSNPMQPIPGTLKEGWIPFMPGGWGDLYMHDFRGIRDLGGSGIDVCVTGGAEGRSGLKVYGMCMCDLNAGCGAPDGSSKGEPIANSWFTSVDRCGAPFGVEGSSQLGLYNLPAGEYELVLYHNMWDPSGRSGRLCTNESDYSGSPIVQIHVWSFADADAFHEQVCAEAGDKCGPTQDALNKMKNFAGADPGTTVAAIEEAYNVMPSTVPTDADVTTSMVKFITDGSPVIIYCESGSGQHDQYHGDRAPLNAFELKSSGVVSCACPGDLNEDGQIDLEDLQGVANILLEGGSPFIVPVDEGHCADLNNDGQADLEDLQAVADILLGAGSPFIVSCY